MTDPGGQVSGDANMQGGAPPGSAFPAPTGGGAVALRSDSNYPATTALDAPLEVTNWRAIANYFLAIPHLIFVSILAIGAYVYAIYAWFTILTSGNMPPNAGNFIAGVQRYWLRTFAFAYFLFEPYPEFQVPAGYADPGGSPVRLDIVPATSYNKMQVALRFLYIIPLWLYGILVAIMMFIGIIIGFFSVLLGSKWNEQWRRTVFGCLTWVTRVNCWYLLLVDEYPPFNYNL